MPTFGNSATSGFTTTEALSQGQLEAQLFAVPEDGWVTAIHVRIQSSSGTASVRVGAWDASLTRVVNGATKSIGTTLQFHSETGLAVKVSTGEDFWIGPLCQTNSANAASVRQNSSLPLATRRLQTGTGNALPNPLAGTSASEWQYNYYADYTANVAPPQPTWRTAPSGTIGTTTPLFEGNLLQGADSALDTIDDFELLVFDTATPSTVYYQQTLATTSTERTQGYFSRSPVTLPGSTQCTARFRTRDSFDVWSTAWSVDTTFTTAPGPGQPTDLSPSAKIDAINSYDYAATYNHAAAVNSESAQLRLYNSSGSSTLFDSGEIAVTSTAPGGTVTIAETSLTGHADLAWATGYQWDIRFKDANDVWGNYSTKQTFRTNTAPDAPTGLTPTGSTITASRVFTASVSDFDADTLTAEMELVNATTNAVIYGTGGSSGGFQAMAVSDGVATVTLNDPPMTLGTNYKWRARANDAAPNSPGAFSDYSFFTYSSVPTLTMLGPRLNRQNPTQQPSAEYDPASLPTPTYWTESARTGADFIDIEADENAFSGTQVWRATASATGDNRFADGDYRTVDGTKPYYFYVRAKKVSGTSSAHFAVLCYDAANTLLGTLYPGTGETGANAANATDIPATWTRYGGIIWPIGSGNSPAFPTGTTKIKRQLTPSRNSVAVVDFDAFDMDDLPTSPPTTANWQSARDWHSYADGDSQGYGLDWYTWVGEEGDSTSNVLSVLGAAPASVAFDYTHAGALTKSDDRLEIQKWNGSAYVAHHDTGYGDPLPNGAREVIPIPSNTLTNEARYRMKVYAKDTSGGIGDSGWIEFDISYDIVTELANFTVTPNTTRASLDASWDAHSLTDSEFAGIELRRYTTDPDELRPELPATFDVITDPDQTTSAYHAPRSALTYRIEARIVKNIGAEQVPSRWVGVTTSVDYSPYSFLKDAEDPANFYAAFDTNIDTLAAIEEDAPTVSVLPWGQSAFSHDISEARLRSGEIVAEFHPDPLSLEPAETRYEKTRDVVFRRRAICILSQLPDPEKMFIAVSGSVSRSMLNVVTKSIRFPYQETIWSEDYYERNGI